MKYFNPSYWFKLWVLSAPLFNDKTQGINAKSIDNKKIKDWASNNTTSLESINQKINYTNSTTNYQLYNLNKKNQNITSFYQSYLDLISNQEFLETSTHKHRHEKSRNRYKRGQNHGNEIESGSEYFYGSFKPEFWEEIVKIYHKYGRDTFINEFKDKAYDYYYNKNDIWIDGRISWNGVKNYAKGIYDNFDQFSNIFENSPRIKRIRIVVEYFQPSGTVCATAGHGGSCKKMTEKINIIEVGIRYGDTKNYNNLYLDNLKRDFPDWNKEKIYLEEIVEYDGGTEDDLNFFLRQNIKNKYPQLSVNCIDFEQRHEYNPNENYNYWIKMRLSSNCDYSYGKLNPKLFYTTKYFLKHVLPKLLWENGSDLFEDWQNKYNQWQITINRQIKEDVPTLSEAEKRIWKDNKQTQLQDKLHQYLQNIAIIDLRIKTKHLYETTKIIKNNLDSIKSEINKLDKRITNLENTSNLNCANIAGIAGAFISVVPIINNIGGAIATITSSACAIAGV